MTRADASALYGTLNLLVLQTLTEGPQHGLGIARRIRSQTQEVLNIEEGALYPALHRLERDGKLTARWGISDQNRRAKFYEMTPAGREYLEAAVDSWVRHTEAVSRVLHVTTNRVT
jgi:transcriptional regulator